MSDLTKKKRIGEYEVEPVTDTTDAIAYDPQAAVGERTRRVNLRGAIQHYAGGAFAPEGSLAEIEAGTDTEARTYAPATLNDAINSLVPDGNAAQVIAGTDTTERKYNPAALNSAIDQLISDAALPSGTEAQIVAGTDTTERAFTPDGINGAVKTLAVAQYDSISDIEAITGQVENQAIYLSAGGRSGTFEWLVGDYSAEVAADTLQGVYIASSSIPASVGVWKRKFDGFVTPGMFGESGGGNVIQSVLDYCRDNGLQLAQNLKSCVIPASGLTVECHVEHTVNTQYDATALAGTVDAVTIRGSTAGDPSASFTGKYYIDMSGAGRDGLVISKGRKIDYGAGVVNQAGRDSLHFLADAANEYTEGCVSSGFKSIQTGRHHIGCTVNDYAAVFSNKHTFTNFEGRGCVDYPIGIYLNGTDPANVQKAAAWSFVNVQLASNGTVRDEAIYVNCAFGYGECNSWSFLSPTFEDTTGTSHGDVFGASHTGKWNGLSVLSAVRFGYPTELDANAAASNVLWTDASARGANSRVNRIIGKTQFDSDIDATVSFLDVGGISSANVQRLVTFVGGTISIPAGGTSSTVDIGAGISGGFEKWTVDVMPVSGGSGTYSQYVVLTNSSGAVTSTKAVVSGECTVATSGSDITVTNTSGGSRSVKVFARRDI